MPFAQPDWDDADPWDDINERYGGEVIPPDWGSEEPPDDSLPPTTPSTAPDVYGLTDPDIPF
ncbi:hypothetical protein [Spirillospora sp. CA-128828]|uniref:hypothetical protein n=1 Tax=Spirillospora sp. CA-128828 TaxID=3240033 RepID=UPI003D8F8383